MTNSAALIESMYFVPAGLEATALQHIDGIITGCVRMAGYPLAVETSLVEDESHNDLDLGAAGDVMIRLFGKNSEAHEVGKTSTERISLPNATINVYRQRKRAQEGGREYKASASIWTLGDDGELVAREAKDPFNSVDDAIKWSAEKLASLE